jgi:hypothetical protein
MCKVEMLEKMNAGGWARDIIWGASKTLRKQVGLAVDD